MASKILENKKDLVVCLAVFFSIISQAPILRVTLQINTSIISGPFWILAALVCAFNLKNTRLNRRTLTIVLLFCIFILLILFNEGLTGNSYIFSYVTKPIYLSLFFFLVGAMMSGQTSNSLVKKIAISYVVASIIISIDIFIEYFLNADLTAVSYIFRSKNSASSILLIAIIFCLYSFSSKKIVLNILRFSAILLFSVLIVIMRARAVIVSLPIIPALYLVSPNKNNKIKIAILAVFGAFVFALIISKDLFNFLINNIMFKAKNSDNVNLDINYLTSNRFYEVLYALFVFESNPIFGNGYYYVDFFLVNSFTNYGFIAGFLLIFISLCPLLFTIKQYKNKNYIAYLTIAITCIFNGLFEGLAPFGPGNKFFILWFLFGLMSNKIADEENAKILKLKTYETKTFFELRI